MHLHPPGPPGVARSRRERDVVHRSCETASNTKAWQALTRHRCLAPAQIETPDARDAVDSLDLLPCPVLSRLAPMATEFRDDRLGRHVRHDCHGLAIDENRTAFSPILWNRSYDWRGSLERAWFPGTHGDVGGKIRMARRHGRCQMSR
ncbi:MAG: DUF2235 domain-containing protein [Gammaproteobacteria bacterium]|nr:DUF2235 domain-containing protein [Gammaproteobacteria bacterium]